MRNADRSREETLKRVAIQGVNPRLKLLQFSSTKHEVGSFAAAAKKAITHVIFHIFASWLMD